MLSLASELRRKEDVTTQENSYNPLYTLNGLHLLINYLARFTQKLARFTQKIATGVNSLLEPPI